MTPVHHHHASFLFSSFKSESARIGSAICFRFGRRQRARPVIWPELLIEDQMMRSPSVHFGEDVIKDDLTVGALKQPCEDILNDTLVNDLFDTDPELGVCDPDSYTITAVQCQCGVVTAGHARTNPFAASLRPGVLQWFADTLPGSMNALFVLHVYMHVLVARVNTWLAAAAAVGWQARRRMCSHRKPRVPKKAGTVRTRACSGRAVAAWGGCTIR